MDVRQTQTPLALLGASPLVDDESVAVQARTARFVDDHIRPSIAGWYDAGELPARELARSLGQLGVLGMHLEGYGCAGMSATAYGLACLELEAGDSGVRSLAPVFHESWAALSMKV